MKLSISHCVPLSLFEVRRSERPLDALVNVKSKHEAEKMVAAVAVEEEETAPAVACLEVCFCLDSGKDRCGRTLCVCFHRSASRRPYQAMVHGVSLALIPESLIMILELSLTSWKA